MELFLIVVLAIALLVVWNSTRNALDRTRDHIERLGRELDFLRDQLAGLVRNSAKTEEAKPAESPADRKSVV